jgi:hypothetical protein
MFRCPLPQSLTNPAAICGKEVVKPLSPTDWKLIFEGKFISLDLSIGNWSFALQASLLDTRRQGPMDGNVVPRRNLRRKSKGPTGERDVFQECHYFICRRWPETDLKFLAQIPSWYGEFVLLHQN